MTQQPVFSVRRALWATLLNVTLGLLLSALTIANLVHQLRVGQSWGVGVLFVILALFFLWQAWMQFRERTPLVEIGPNGLHLPGVSAEILPWSRLRQVTAGRGLPGLGGGRVDFTVDPETFAHLKLGQRFMGDVVVKSRGRPNTFSVVTPQLEERADAIYAAVKRYWPPDGDEED
ncbi:MAG TPA: hypothetical protein VHM01_19490 [Alphaproteobacteria bacterium]|nr:hypothetical protein [Alphaproteobacteria bacterium]